MRTVKRPTLAALDFRISRATRYVPKPTGGFYTEVANIGPGIGKPCGEVAWGSPEGLAQIEGFRIGTHVGQRTYETVELEQA